MTTSSSNSDRRKFERLDLSDDAIAVDRSGRELGKVTQASGGGVMIKPANEEVSKSLSQGQRVQITIMEPSSQTRHTIDMVVRYCDADQVGLEFIGGKSGE